MQVGGKGRPEAQEAPAKQAPGRCAEAGLVPGYTRGSGRRPWAGGVSGWGRKAWVGEAVALDQRSSVGRGRKAASGDIPAHHDWGCCWRHGPHYPGWPQKSEVLRLRNAGLEQCVSSFSVCTHLLEA